MDRRVFVRILPRLFKIGAVALVCVATYSGIRFLGHRMSHWQWPRLAQIQAKLDSMRYSQEDNVRLRLENANLRLRAEELQFEQLGKLAQIQVEKTGKRLFQETGSMIGRGLAAIRYQVPKHLLPPQLYALAVNYFRTGEDEKAAVILTYLTEFQENEIYQTPINYLMTGIAWYRLNNYELAENYFARILQDQDLPLDSKILAQVRLWRALIAKKLGKHSQSQEWLINLIEHHPHSIEAQWINPKQEEGRVPASSKHGH